MKMRTGFGIFFLACAAALMWMSPASAQKMEIVLQSSNLLERAASALLRGEVEEAAALYARALEAGVSDRETYKALNNLCVAQYLLEDYEAAAASCKAAITHRTNRWMAYNNLALVLARLGRYEEAIRAVRQGLKLAPHSDRLQRNLVLIERAYREGRPDGLAPDGTRPSSRGVV